MNKEEFRRRRAEIKAKSDKLWGDIEGRTGDCPCATRRTSIYKGLATLPYKM